MENNKNNASKNIKKHKGLFIKKNNDINDLIKVKDYFEDPNKFFTKDKKMIIGNLNLNQNKQLKNRKKIKSFSLSEASHNILNNDKIKELKLKININSKSKSFTQGQTPPSPKNKSKLILSNGSRPKTSLISKKKNYNFNSNINSYLYNLRTSSEYNKENIGIHYQRKSFNEVLKLLQNSKSREEENKSKNKDNFLPKELKEELKQNFNEQEKILNNEVKLKNKSDFLSKVLSKKLKRKEDELLFNKIEEYRLKRQLIEYIENSKSMRDKFGDNYWIADLRRPKVQNEIRFNYFNNGNKNNINLDKIIDYADKNIEFINNPYRFKKNKYAKLIRNLSCNSEIKISDLEQMNEIGIIKGKSLIDQEYLGIVDVQSKLNNKRTFKLYKDPSEKKYKNIKDLVYGENYDDIKNYKNKSFKISNHKNYEEKINLKTKNKKNKNNALFRSQSQIKKKKEDKNKINYLKEAMEIFRKENKKKSIKILEKY